SPHWASELRPAAAALLIALTASWSAAAPRTHTVVIDGMRFEPQALAVQRGDRIVWRNRDLVPHTATARGVFDSGSIAPGATWSTVVRKEAMLTYVCTFH